MQRNCRDANGAAKAKMSCSSALQDSARRCNKPSGDGYNSCFTPANTLLAELKEAEIGGSLAKALDRYIKPKLLVLDDVGPVTEKADYRSRDL